MSDIVIKAENLGKMYTIGHQAENGRYTALRDVLMQNARTLWRKTKDLATGKPIIQGDTMEEVWALKDVSFEIRQGEAVGIIGRNGAGKSTLLKVLSRITEPSTGRVTIKGRVASLLEVGTGFHPELTGRENIYLNGTILGMTRVEIKRKFDEIVAFAEVEKYLDTPVKRYSSGMYVRLAFAVAAHLEPEILVVDEVLAVGDAAFQKKCLGKMGDVAKEGRTVLFVSHNMAAIQNLCRRGMVLTSGVIDANGTAQQAIDIYLGSIQNSAALDLAKRTDRRGRGEILITKIEVLDEDYHPINNAISGQNVIIRLYYAANKNKVFHNCRMSVSIHIHGTAYVLLSSELITNEELVLTGDGFVDCMIPELPLSRGEYYLTSFIEANKTIQDLVDAAAALSVIDGDFYGTGRNYPPGWEGLTVLVKHHWKW
jgi:lipopolysaccharide transport system ATP-binding protein